MPEQTPRRLSRIFSRERKPPSERDWEHSTVLEPCPAAREPELISDGAGLPFAPAALVGSPPALDAEDPAAAALLENLSRMASRSGATQPRPVDLEGWRLLARTDGECLFAHGVPPRLLTVAVRQDTRRRTWSCVASSSSRSLRATRDGIRASSWRTDPTHPVEPDETLLRVLVTEQTFAGGQPARGRVLAPDMFSDDDVLILRIYVKPRPGYQPGAPNPETPVRIALPHPVGRRRLIDGALLLPA